MKPRNIESTGGSEGEPIEECKEVIDAGGIHRSSLKNKEPEVIPGFAYIYVEVDYFSISTLKCRPTRQSKESCDISLPQTK